MSDDQIISWLVATLRWGGPLILVSVGEVFAERSGVINVGIEGIMLCGALAGVAISFFTGNVLIATIGTMLLGGLLGMAFAYLTVTRRTNQVVTGLMFNLAALGGTNLLFALLSADPVRAGSDLPAAVPRELRKHPDHWPCAFPAASDYLDRLDPALHCQLGPLSHGLGA